MDRVGAFFEERTVRRVVAVAVFVALLALFRHLLPLLVFFVAFERSLGAASLFLAQRTKLTRKLALLLLVVFGLGGVALLVGVGVGRGAHHLVHMRETLPEKIASVRESLLYQRFHEHVGDPDKVVEGAKHYAGDALRYASAIGHILVYSTVGLILAVVYLLEEEHLSALRSSIDPGSLIGTLIRWLGHLCDAVTVTVQLQLVVAACNAVLTLPVLLLLRIPHVPSLMVLIFVSGLVPVVGNFVSGVVLSVLAYHAHGWAGVALFATLTAILHKIESYYLNPRLTARHVSLPGFVLIVSLIAWEHLLGFVGLFVSFPFLFVGSRIKDEMRSETEADS
jgi:predicted PurR-regulated permease PerM